MLLVLMSLLMPILDCGSLLATFGKELLTRLTVHVRVYL